MQPYLGDRRWILVEIARALCSGASVAHQGSLVALGNGANIARIKIGELGKRASKLIYSLNSLAVF